MTSSINAVAGAFLLASAAILSGCGSPASPVAPSIGSAPVASVAGSTSPRSAVAPSPRQSQISICHSTEGAPAFLPLSIAGAALDAHLGHGDALVGAVVPGLPQMIFGTDCSQIPTTPSPGSGAPMFHFASMGCDGGTTATAGYGAITYTVEGTQIQAEVQFANGPANATLPVLWFGTGGSGCRLYGAGSITTDASGNGTTTVAFDIGTHTTFWVALDGGSTQWGSVPINVPMY